MSRAFTKERDDEPEPLIVSHSTGAPVHVTPAGRSKLEDQLARTQSASERKRLEQLIADIVVIGPPENRNVVAFGATVVVCGAAAETRRFTVVGADEADVPAGRISESSPLGIALLGAHLGDVVTWHRPAGDIDITVEAIAYDGDARAERPASA